MRSYAVSFGLDYTTFRSCLFDRASCEFVPHARLPHLRFAGSSNKCFARSVSAARQNESGVSRSGRSWTPLVRSGIDPPFLSITETLPHIYRHFMTSRRGSLILHSQRRRDAPYSFGHDWKLLRRNDPNNLIPVDWLGST